MSERNPSQTALSVAVLRAFHQEFDDAPKILVDDVVLRLLEPHILELMREHPERFRVQQSLGLRTHVLIRSRYAEDRLALAAARGVPQFVSLGAGFDTFAYRQPEWAHRLRIFEVDHPASQRVKRQRLQEAGIAVPDNVEFVPIDFETTTLRDGLAASSFDFARPAFFAWLGVMIYLTQEAIDAVWQFVASLPRGSELVFTFAPPRGKEAQRPGPTLADLAARAGEPWLTYTAPEELTRQLHAAGFSEVNIPTQAEIDTWYIRGRQDGLMASARTTLASAVV